MADPKIEEFCRAHDFKHSFLRDMQRYLRDEIQPKLERLDVLEAQFAESQRALASVAAQARKNKQPGKYTNEAGTVTVDVPAGDQGGQQ